MAKTETKIKEEIHSILSKLGIQRVVVVDDYYSTYPTVEYLIGAIDTYGYKRAGYIPAFKDLIVLDQDALSNERIERAWDAWSKPERIEMLENIVKRFRATDKQPDELVTFGPMFTDLFEGIDFRPLSLAEWKAQKDQLIADTATTPTLFLFDQDFSEEGGSNREGILLISNLLENELPNAFCGLLSHTATVANEREMWRQLINEYPVKQGQFIFIAKERLSGDMDGFAKMIKLTVLNDKCDRLKKEAAKIIDATAQAAHSEIDALDVFEFDQIVIQSSQTEGIWALDTLIRLYSLFQKTKARAAARENLPLQELLVEVRQASELPPISSERTQAVKIYRLENYEEPPFINEFHLPLECGDIFINTATNQKYILVAQPCDIILRSNGERKIRSADLLPIQDTEPESNEHFYFRLPYYLGEPDNAQDAWVDLRIAFNADLELFDLCVFGVDGSAEYVRGSYEGKRWLPPTDALFDIVTARCEGFLSGAQTLAERGIPQDVIEQTLPRPSVERDFPVKLDLEAGMIGFALQRVRRLCPARATALLTDFNNVQARPAFDHDFAREPAAGK